MDHSMSGKRMHEIAEHLNSCRACRSEFNLLRNTQKLVSDLGRKQPPPDLALKLRVMISQELAQSRKKPFEGLRMRFENAFNAFMVPATAGMISAIIIFGLLIGVLYPAQISRVNDVPTLLYTPPELTFSPFGLEMNGINADSLVVEAYVDANGRVQDYRILSAPEDAKDLVPELNKMLIFTTFRPATAFGLPTNGRAVLSFAKVNVRG
jgi:uncharacterized protein YihD (DUF1040 family)